MDLDTVDGLSQIRPSVHRVAMKLLSLQRLCHLDGVSLCDITAALSSVGGACRQDVGLNRQEVTYTLNRMFQSVSQEVPSHLTVEKTCSLMFRLYDRSQVDSVPAASLKTALISLCSDNLQDKYTALVRVSGSGSISRSEHRSLLQDLSQVPAAVQEEVVFGDVEAALRSCFHGMLIVTEDHVLSWLQSEPCLLLWLPTLYRLSVSQNICHSVRCHICKATPIRGLRYRCVKCVNVHVCQSCFLTEGQTTKHKVHHPVLEFCTQPTWRECVSSLVRNARHSLLPRRYTRRKDQKRILKWAEPGETQNSAPPPADESTQLADSPICHSPSHDAPVQPDSSSSEVLKADEKMSPQVSVLMDDVRTLQRDRRLLEQEIQVWRLTVQSKQSILEDKCSEIEVTVETLRQHTASLEGTLTQAVSMMEAQHGNNTPHSVDMKMECIIAISDKQKNTEEEEEEEGGAKQQEGVGWGLEEEEEAAGEEEILHSWRGDEQQTSSSTIHLGLSLSQDISCEEVPAGDMSICCPIGQEDGLEEAGQQDEDDFLSKDEEDCGMCSLEELLKETVDRLKTMLETDRWRDWEMGVSRGAELLEAAEQVGDSVHHLVDAVRTNPH